MSSTRYTPIHDDDELVVFHKATGSDVTILAFNNYGTIYPTPKVWGTDFIDRSGFNAVVFMAKKRNWFPSRAMAPAIAAVRRHLGTPAFSLTFGNSMGGYAAIKYQKPLQADACLAFNPQYTIDPAGCSFDGRFSSYWTPELAGMDVVPEDVGRQAFVFYDPCNPQDTAHVRVLAGMPGIFGIPVFHTGHVTVRSVVRGSTIPDMVDIIRTRAADAPTRVRLLLRQRKKSSFDYYHSLAKALLARRHPRMLALLLDFMERHGQLKPHNLETIRRLALELPPSAALAGEAAIAQPPASPVPPVLDPPARGEPGAAPPLASRGSLPRFSAPGDGGSPPARRSWLGRLWPYPR